MNWFLIALIAPAVWAVVNHIDKFIISRYFSGRGVGSLVIFTSLAGLILSVLILIFSVGEIFIRPASAVLIALNGAILVFSFIPYLYALEKEEASWVSTLFQLIPVFSYFLGLAFLGEHLALKQIFASLLVICGAVFISLDFSQKMSFKWKPLIFMTLSSFLLAVNGLIFKFVALDEKFLGTAFWEYIGGAIFGLFLFTCIPLYRRQFLATIERSRAKVLLLNTVSEGLNIVAKLAINFASLFAPLALVWVVNNGFQPFLVLIFGALLTVFVPSLGKENLDRKNLAQKISAMAAMFVGIYFLFV